MIYAQGADGSRLSAAPHGQGHCPQCGEGLTPHCGAIKVWHWAHRTRPDCDQWTEPESEWHLRWKAYFATLDADVEVTMRRNGEWHRADIVTTEQQVIELQHGSLSPQEAAARERFYGKNMLWLIDMTDPERWERVHWGKRGFWWKHGARWQVGLRRPLIWDTPEDLIEVRLGVVTNGGHRRVLGQCLGLVSL